jgi:predicted extracellular nuclease
MDVDEYGDNPYPIPYIGDQDTLRAGDTVAGVTGVIDEGLITTPTDPWYYYRLQPTEEVTFTRVNERTATPDEVGGTLLVAGFNVLNYFTTLDEGPWICGPNEDQECRGANTAEEFTRQRDKIIPAIQAIDADIVGLVELENNITDVPIADLVSGLNDAMGAGTYDYVATGDIGGDAIRQGLIYKPATVTPVGAYAILDSSVDPRFNSDRNRPVLAQTFMENATGEMLTVAVNHLKSKGSSCDDIGDPDIGDGQGNCNLTRTDAAIALGEWLATDPTASGDPDSLIIGDLNAYAMEDPITALTDQGYANLVYDYLGLWTYSYTFDGQAGYLDHALSSPSLAAQVTGATIWHINTDEPAVIDYNTEYKSEDLYTPTPYRASDHDAVVVGLDLQAAEEPFDVFSMRRARIQWRGAAGDRAVYSLQGEFVLPPTFHPRDLTQEMELTIAIADKSGSDLVLMQRNGRVWFFQEHPPVPADGLEIEKAQVVWPLSGSGAPASFRAQGRFVFPGVDYQTLPAEATVTLRLPAGDSAPASALVGEETIAFDVYDRMWEYIR